MITGTVSSDELDPKKRLRAEDYLINPKRTAELLVTAWLRETGLNTLFRKTSPQIKHLLANVENGIRIAYERGADSQRRS